LCETHIDPHGYLEGTYVPPTRRDLYRSGDMLATVMGWIGEEEPLGGATAFVADGKEVTIWPRRGSAAFWYWDMNERWISIEDCFTGTT